MGYKVKMQMKKPLFQRICHRLHRMRLHPIHVFVFHQVSNVFEPETMWECDWTQTEAFKKNVLALKERYTFISLEEAKLHLGNDKLRLKDYAVLTSDDGWASLTNIIPWLAEQEIPVTLFLNPLYLDGIHWRSRDTEKLLTKEEVIRLVEDFSPFVTVASHGWTHDDCTRMTIKEFSESVVKSEEVLSDFPAKVPFFAFASGRYTNEQVNYLKSNSLVPVLVDGMSNLEDNNVIHRECIDGKNETK